MAGVDETSWVELYRALEKPLYNVVYRWLWDSTESEDIVQEAFMRCWRARDRIRPEGFKAFVYRTALNLASNRRRARKLWRFVSFESLQEEPADARRGAPLLSRHVQQAIDSLPETLRRVLLLCELAGLSYGEVAAIAGVREGTVGSRRNRALALVRQRLQSPKELSNVDRA